MNILKREIIMSAKIEYCYNAIKEGRSITSNMRLENKSDVSLQDEVEKTILSRLPADMAQIYGLTVKTRLITSRYGSLTVFFGVILTGLAFIANYKSFFDSCELIRDHLRLLLSGRLREKVGEELDITVSIEQPKLEDPRKFRFPSKFRRIFKNMALEPEFAEAFGLWQLMEVRRQTRRDAFFWFLLVFCVLLIGIVGILVFAAVKKTYFP